MDCHSGQYDPKANSSDHGARILAGTRERLPLVGSFVVWCPTPLCDLHEACFLRSNPVLENDGSMADKRFAVVSVLLFPFVLSGCSGSSGFKNATISPSTADLIAGDSVQFTTNISTNASELSWSVNSIAGGNATVGTIGVNGRYTAPAAQPQAPVTVTVASLSKPANSASATVTVVDSGTVTTTSNPQVAAYKISPPVPATVSVEFGTDTTYGVSTSTQDAAGNAALLSTLVAGMKANTTYHMRALLQMPDGTQLADSDHTFTTSAYPNGTAPQLTVTNPSGTPQSGVEMLDLIGAGPVVVVDLSGNLLWSYKPTGVITSDIVQPVKPLPNGHFVLVISPSSTFPLSATPLPLGTLNLVREIDLEGTIIREITIDDLNSRLTSAGFTFNALDFHHDIAVLPNGHWIVLVNSIRQFTFGGGPTTNVLGDALVDLDENLNPIWLWDSFDHLDVNRHPMAFPDWTHSNAVLYSATDGNLLLSIRHQNWIVKIDYANGQGAGDVLWRLGQGGDFTLQGGSDPVDWFYAQHGPSFPDQTTSGNFSLAVFDNGNDRMYPTGQICDTTNSPSCPYSTAQVLNIDETNKTATLAFHQDAFAFSNFGGNIEVLGNKNVEYDEASVPGTAPGSAVFEVTPDASPQTIWQMSIANANAYRAFRMPSLYPGVQW